MYRGSWSGGSELSCYMGRDADWSLAESGAADRVDADEYPGFGVHWTDPRRPWESIADGCPGGWYRCEFIDSFRPYRRRMVEGGGHDSNPTLDRCNHWLVLEAVQYYEQCESNARVEYQRQVDAKMRVK